MMTFFVVAAVLAVFWLDFLAQEGVGIRSSILGTSGISYAIVLELSMMMIIVFYAWKTNDAVFLFCMSGLLIAMMFLGYLIGAGG
jgi:hypothetical protein